MITVKLMGGLGNQMFQYALARKLQTSGKKVNLDVSYYYHIPEGDTPRRLWTEKFHSSFTETDISRSLFQKIKILSARLLGKNYIITEECPDFLPSILTVRSGVLLGYWQSEKYFKDISQTIRKDFEFPLETLEEKERILYQKIKMLKASVSIHVRRGDYLHPENNLRFGNICTAEYYKKATDYFINRIPNCSFFIFTDAPAEVQHILPKHITYEIISTGENDEWFELFLMSQCKHNIIANSSFSWWGAWLNSNPNKMVVAPARWTNQEDCHDIFCDNWIIIS